MINIDICLCLNMSLEERGKYIKISYINQRPLYFKRPLVPTMSDVPLRLS